MSLLGHTLKGGDSDVSVSANVLSFFLVGDVLATSRDFIKV